MIISDEELEYYAKEFQWLKFDLQFEDLPFINFLKLRTGLKRDKYIRGMAQSKPPFHYNCRCSIERYLS